MRAHAGRTHEWTNDGAMATLVFPALTQSALDYLDAARDRGEQVVAAASVYDARMAEAYGGLTVLPYVYDAGFRQAFLDLIGANEIDAVYAPVASVHAFLEAFIAKEGLGLALLGAPPIRSQVDSYRRLRAKAQHLQPFIDACAASPGATLSVVETAAIFRYAGLVYGESNDDKLA